MNDSATVKRRKDERYAKIVDVQALNGVAYPYSYSVTHYARDILSAFSHLKPEEHSSSIVKIAGRVMITRSMGKAGFFVVQDSTAKIQIYVQEDTLKELYPLAKKTDSGDFIGVQGEVFKSKTGELTIFAHSYSLLCKAIRDLPDKFHGVTDPELLYRQRYLDFLLHPTAKDIIIKKSELLKATRAFLDARGFIEVETPLLQTQYGGANARPFITHINAWDMPMYLSISPELYLKRLLVGGFDKVYTVCKNFRNEGVDYSHNPEFTMLEAYQTYVDYFTMMDLTEQLFAYICTQLHGSTKVQTFVRDAQGAVQESVIDFSVPWKRYHFFEALEQLAGINPRDKSVEELQAFVASKGISVDPSASWGSLCMTIFEECVEHQLIQPTHVYDRPKESTPLCKVSRIDSRLVEQCEPFAGGMEIANMYSELNDPRVQRSLFEEQVSLKQAGDDEAHPLDEDFIRAIEQGMPPAGGLGVGIDRLAILLCQAKTIRDVIAFPTTKPEVVGTKQPKV
jgi:lysyl-tRNA synthetase, class II